MLTHWQAESGVEWLSIHVRDAAPIIRACESPVEGNGVFSIILSPCPKYLDAGAVIGKSAEVWWQSGECSPDSICRASSTRLTTCLTESGFLLAATRLVRLVASHQTGACLCVWQLLQDCHGRAAHRSRSPCPPTV
jgi:hypothetical protein